MDYGDSFYNNSIGENDLGNIAAQELSVATTTATATTTHLEQMNQQETLRHAMPHQTFYPTPNSTNMHPGQLEKSFMSPFPAFYPQKYPNMSAETSYSDFDEVTCLCSISKCPADSSKLLFTPMMSPAMTPMQQLTNGMQRTADVDWDQFDQNLFAITGPAIASVLEETSGARSVSTSKTQEPAFKKQRVKTTGAKHPRHASPPTPHSVARTKDTNYHHKRDNNAMAAPPLPDSNKTSSTDSNDGVSPVDLTHFGVASAHASLEQRQSHVQPITPSMLMSLQSQTRPLDPADILPARNDLSIDIASIPTFPELQAIDSPLLALPSPSRQATSRAASTTPVNANTTPNPNANNGSKTPVTTASAAQAREIRPRPIASIHSRSRSVNSSPALGPQRSRTSPELRPILPGGMSPQVGAMLASKSNYQHIVDGTYDQLNITYPQGMTQGLEVRRTSHKAAEQKRRDHLKECFEQLRTILPVQPDAGASKVAILKAGYEHILDLQAAAKRQDAEVERLAATVEALTRQSPSAPPPAPPPHQSAVAVDSPLTEVVTPVPSP